MIVIGPLMALGYWDLTQTRHAVLRNFPVIGHFRYLFEAIRPEINQYFVESDVDGRPFNRIERSVVYQRAKRQLDTLPFGTRYNLYKPGCEWINHSLSPTAPPEVAPRISIGVGQCEQPYASSVLNISAMSYGSLSHAAISALNTGARRGSFAHNTGEGGISPYHLEGGGDLIWQIGTGYFGCRTPTGQFNGDLFSERAALPNVKMIEIKLSQGAKPGHGGILPGDKVTPEIAKIRGVQLGKDVISPPAHSAFSTPLQLCEFAQQLRQRSGGKPVGIKLCLGKRHEFLSICKAMIETDLPVDYIAVDGAEGGTGAAPLEFSNSMGCPLTEALVFVHNALVGVGLRDRVKIVASGKLITGFHLARALALGADVCASARGMMFALGCIQALRCNNNTCPTGVATHKPSLVKGLVATDKSQRVFHYHEETVASLLHMLAATGLQDPADLRPWHIHRRISSTQVRHYGENVRLHRSRLAATTAAATEFCTGLATGFGEPIYVAIDSSPSLDLKISFSSVASGSDSTWLT